MKFGTRSQKLMKSKKVRKRKWDSETNQSYGNTQKSKCKLWVIDKLKDVEFYSVHNREGSITYLFSVSAHQHMSEGKCSFSSEGCNIHDRETNHSLQHMQKSKERREKIVKLNQVGNGNETARPIRANGTSKNLKV